MQSGDNGDNGLDLWKTWMLILAHSHVALKIISPERSLSSVMQNKNTFLTALF